MWPVPVILIDQKWAHAPTVAVVENGFLLFLFKVSLYCILFNEFIVLILKQYPHFLFTFINDRNRKPSITQVGVNIFNKRGESRRKGRSSLGKNTDQQQDSRKNDCHPTRRGGGRPRKQSITADLMMESI